MPRGRTTSPPPGNIVYAAVEIERRHEAGAERQRRHVGQIAAARRRSPAAARRAMPTAAADRRRRRCSIRAAPRAASAASGCSPSALRGLHSRIVRRRDVSQIRQHRHRRIAALERRRVDDRLERRAGLPAAARRAVERAARVVARRRPSPGCRRSADRSRPAPPRGRGRLQAVRARRRPPARPPPAAPARNDVCTCQSGGWSPPNSLRNCWRRYSFAQPARVSLGWPIRLDARAHAARRLLLRRRDEPLLAHRASTTWLRSSAPS